MLLRLRRAVPGPQIDAILALAEELGYRARFVDESRAVLLLEGPGRPDHRSRFAGGNVSLIAEPCSIDGWTRLSEIAPA